VTYTYKFAPGEILSPTAADDVLATLRLPEFAGFLWIGSSLDGQKLLYRKGAVPAFTYELGTNTDLFQMGARGFLGMGEFLRTSKQLFGKPSADSASYQYASHSDPFSTAPADFLNELNAAGSFGFCRLMSSNLLMRRNEASPANCTFEVLNYTSGALEAYLDVLNSQGAKGYEPSTNIFGTQYWVKDTTQQVTYYYYALDMPNTDIERLNQANAEGAKGAIGWVGALSFRDKTIYRRATNCSRWWLCGG
jgi:hypothetical protein